MQVKRQQTLLIYQHITTYNQERLIKHLKHEEEASEEIPVTKLNMVASMLQFLA